MPSNRRADPAPLETNDVAIVTAGTVLWAVALLALILLRDQLDADGRERWVWVAAAGTFLGLVGVRNVRRRRAARSAGRSRDADPSVSPAAPKRD